MKISILCPSLSSNGLGRAYLLAKVLQRRYDVEIIGPLFGQGIWPPLAHAADVELTPVRIGPAPLAYCRLAGLFARKVTGDVIYACKPMLMSLGVGLWRRCRQNRPLVLDIDDWDFGLARQLLGDKSLIRKARSLAYSTLCFYRGSSYWNTALFQRLAHRADAITVSNTFLKAKFGGTIICHGRDTNRLDPAGFDAAAIRDRYNIPQEKKVVMFLGTPTPPKGLDDLVEAVGSIGQENVLLLIVGTDESDYCRRLISFADTALPGRFRAFGMQPFEAVPQFLAMADVVVIPQRANLATAGQVPAKVFDAMAMAKPVVATAVSDLPAILSGCGWITPPQDPRQLAQTIGYVLDHPAEAAECGRAARRRCRHIYSYDAMDRVLHAVFAPYEPDLRLKKTAPPRR